MDHLSIGRPNLIVFAVFVEFVGTAMPVSIDSAMGAVGNRFWWDCLVFSADVFRASGTRASQSGRYGPFLAVI